MRSRWHNYALFIWHCKLHFYYLEIIRRAILSFELSDLSVIPSFAL